MRPTVLILTALLAAACSSGGVTSPGMSSTATATMSSVAGAGRCQDVAVEGQPVTDALIDKGCADDKGSLRLGKATACKDGRRLWEMGDLIGLSGETLLPRDLKAEGGVTAEALNRRACRG